MELIATDHKFLVIGFVQVYCLWHWHLCFLGGYSFFCYFFIYLCIFTAVVNAR